MTHARDRLELHLAAEWHPKKNKGLTPDAVRPYSHKKAWWKCKMGHVWEARIGSRSEGHGCPYCAGTLVCEDNCLGTSNPALAAEWHPHKNKGLTPYEVTQYSQRKAWWICKKGHEWEASVGDRNRGSECPYCSGARVCEDNCLGTINPALAAEWHPKKNKGRTPYEVTPYSQGKAWWICKKSHEWEELIGNRNRGSGCPYCSGLLATKDNSLKTINPTVAKEWHPHKNCGLTPSEVTQYSAKKVWWICKKGHEWAARVGDRNRGSGCPYCSGAKVCEDNCLGIINPALAAEWHPKKNNGITPHEVMPNSPRKAWWICKKGHEWEARIGNRNRGNGCPYCSGRLATKDTSLEAINPTVAKEWHPHKNSGLTLSEVTQYSARKVWWLCKKGHEWEARVASRNRGIGCPYCSGRLATKDTCLGAVNPTLAKEWHPSKNGNLTPRHVKKYSSNNVWWLCNKGHTWQATIIRRSLGSGCPKCARRRG
jgi:uncharacterized Zn-finger protein